MKLEAGCSSHCRQNGSEDVNRRLNDEPDDFFLCHNRNHLISEIRCEINH